VSIFFRSSYRELSRKILMRHDRFRQVPLLLTCVAVTSASVNDCALPLGRRPIHEMDKVATVICNVSTLHGGLIVVGSTPPGRGEDWWYGISSDDEVAYTSNVNRARYDITRGSKVSGDRLYIPKRRGAGVGAWAITTGRHVLDLSLGCPARRDPYCWVLDFEVCDATLFLAVATDEGKHLQALNTTTGRRLWTYDLGNVSEPRLRASSAQGCKLWVVYQPQVMKRKRIPLAPYVEAFTSDGAPFFSAPLTGTMMVGHRAFLRLAPTGDALAIVFAGTATQGWAAARQPGRQPSTLVDCLWLVETRGTRSPTLFFSNPSGPKPPMMRFGGTSELMYFQSNKALFVVPRSARGEMMQYPGATGAYYVDHRQNIYFVKKDANDVRLWKVLPDGEVAWHRAIDLATSVLMVCGSSDESRIHVLTTRPRNRTALASTPYGQLMDVIFLHANRTDTLCAPLFADSGALDMLIGMATGAAAVSLLVVACYLYRHFTYARVEERWHLANGSSPSRPKWPPEPIITRTRA